VRVLCWAIIRVLHKEIQGLAPHAGNGDRTTEYCADQILG